MTSAPFAKRPLRVLLFGLLVSSPLLAQRIHITIPRRSELTPVQKLNREGVDYVVKHKYEKAESTFFKAYLYDPADPFTLNNLGYVSELQGEVDRAADYYKRAGEQGSEAIIDRSSESTLKGKPMMDALTTIKNLPMRVNRTNIYAMQLLSQNRGIEAEALLMQALPLDPENPFTLNNLGIAEQANGNMRDALKYYEAAAQTHSTQPVVVALQRSARGKAISEVAAASAEKLRTRMANMTANQIEAQMLSVQGVAALNRNDLQTARKDFEAAYAADPASGFTLNNIGYVAEQDGDLETAVSYYARARRAENADDPVGSASQTEARGQHLSDLAQHSRRDTAAALQARVSTAPQVAAPAEEPIELIRRDGTPEPATAPAPPADQPPALNRPTVN